MWSQRGRIRLVSGPAGAFVCDGGSGTAARAAAAPSKKDAVASTRTGEMRRSASDMESPRVAPWACRVAGAPRSTHVILGEGRTRRTAKKQGPRVSEGLEAEFEIRLTCRRTR